MEYIKRKIKKDIMQQILDNFVELTGIRAAYFDDYKELINGKNKKHCEFCTYINQVPALHQLCLNSDKNACMESEQSGKTLRYKCHMGLWEVICPVHIRGYSAGYLMLGQVKGSENKGGSGDLIARKLSSGGVSDNIINKAVEAFDRMQTYDSARINAAARMLELIAGYMMETEIVRVYDVEAIEKSKEMISKNFNKHLSVEHLARIVDLSPSYLSFLFKKQTGMTITSYIDDLRITQAKKLLSETSRQVKDISASCGYADQNYFSRIFRKHTGISPVAYRKDSRSSDRA